MKERINYIIQAGGFDDATNWGEDVGRPAVCRQLRAVMGDRLDGRRIETPEQAGEYLAMGGQWAVYIDDARDDLRDVFGIEEEDDGEMWARYCKECGKVCAEIYGGAI